jgi:hypothetical protein
VISNNITDADHDIDISAGEARDSANAVNLTLASAITKRIDAAWAVGTDQGGLDGSESTPGTPDADTWYYVHLIRRSDTGVVDVLFSESSSAPTMPADYDERRLIGAVLTDGSANIIAFVARESDGGGLRVLWDASQVDFDSTIGTSESLITVSVPTIVGVRALISAYITKSSTATAAWISSPLVSDQAPAAGIRSIGSQSASDSGTGSGHYEIETDSGQVRARASAVTTTFQVGTRGWAWGRR